MDKRVTPMEGTGKWASDFCKALGGDPEITRSTTLRVAVGEAVVVTFEEYVDKDNPDVIMVLKEAEDGSFFENIAIGPTERLKRYKKALEGARAEILAWASNGDFGPLGKAFDILDEALKEKE